MKIKTYKLECPHCDGGYVNLNDETFSNELPCEYCGESLNVNAMLEDIADTLEFENGF